MLRLHFYSHAHGHESSYFVVNETPSLLGGWLQEIKEEQNMPLQEKRYQAQISTGPDWNRDVRLQSKELSRKTETCVTQYCQQTRLVLEHSASSFCEVSTDALME